MDKCREAFEDWFRTTKAYQMLEEQNYFKMDLFHFVDGRNEYRHTSVQIAFMTWQSRQDEFDKLNKVLDERTKEWLEAIKLGTYFQEAAKPLKDEVEQLNKTLSIKSKFLEDSDVANKFLSEQLEEKKKQIEVLENRIEEGLGFIDQFHCEGRLEGLDDAEKALRGEHE